MSPDGEEFGEGSYFDGGPIEGYEDSTRASRPSDHGETLLTDDQAEDAIDMIICRLRRQGWNWRLIGKILNRSKTNVQWRYQRFPAERRAYYAKAGLWGMG